MMGNAVPDSEWHSGKKDIYWTNKGT